jgi:hypothetical protein
LQECHCSGVLEFGRHNPNPAMNRAAQALLIRRNGGSRRLWAGSTLRQRILRQK